MFSNPFPFLCCKLLVLSPQIVRNTPMFLFAIRACSSRLSRRFSRQFFFVFVFVCRTHLQCTRKIYLMKRYTHFVCTLYSNDWTQPGIMCAMQAYTIAQSSYKFSALDGRYTVAKSAMEEILLSSDTHHTNVLYMLFVRYTIQRARTLVHWTH